MDEVWKETGGKRSLVNLCSNNIGCASVLHNRGLVERGSDVCMCMCARMCIYVLFLRVWMYVLFFFKCSNLSSAKRT